jgi:hypothetical protein
MGYIPSADTVYAVAYLTETGRRYLFDEDGIRFDTNGDDLFEITKFTLSDTDTNYQTLPILETGEVPDVTGKSEGCLKTTANYVQTNLLAFVFDDTPTNVEYETDLDPGTPPTLLIPENSLPDTTETPPANTTGPIIGTLPGGFSPAATFNS